jgi:Trypsin-like peptidase domain
MVLGDRHVLTCAHILSGASRAGAGDTAPGVDVTVDPVGLPGERSIRARIAPRGWAPPTGGGRGDIALLELDQPIPEGSGAPLRKLSMSIERRVRMCGFSDSLEVGVFVRGTLLAYSPGGERIQVNTSAPGPQVRRGFSGAAVIDERTGFVVGMLVSFYSDPAAGVSWMIPVDTIVSYIPAVGRWVTGVSAVDYDVGDLHGTGDEEFARQVSDLFARRLDRNVLIIITGAPDSQRAVALRRAAVLSNRQQPPGAARSAPHDDDPSIPPLGSIDLTVDASGRTSQEVCRRILDWAGVPDGNSPGPDSCLVAEVAPGTMIIDGIDESADTEALLSGVVEPIVRQAAEGDMRLVLAFRRESVQARLALLRPRIEEVVEVQKAVRELRRRIVDGGADLPSAATLYMRLVALEKALEHTGGDGDAADRGDRASLLDELASCERATDRALHTMVPARQRLDAALSRRDELRGLLEAYAAGQGEDVALGVLYRQARETLWVAPCDLAAAAAAVERYADEARRGRPPQE